MHLHVYFLSYALARVELRLVATRAHTPQGTDEYGEVSAIPDEVQRGGVLEVGCGQHFTVALVGRE
jgi:hypothetical protein